jgi:chorismate dehydratase
VSSEDGNYASGSSTHRLGALPFLAARPLIEGLDGREQVRVTRALPAELLELLVSGNCHATMLGLAELQHCPGAPKVLSAGCLAVGGTTFFARVFSRVEPQDLRVIQAGPASQTAAALAQVLWTMEYQQPLRVIPCDRRVSALTEDPVGAVVAGDSVVTDPPLGFDYHIDLAAMWRRLTGLPFVFAVWATTDLADCDTLNELLSGARRLGQVRLKDISNQYAEAHGWPDDLAEHELTEHLEYEMTVDHIESMTEFAHLAADVGAFASVRDMDIVLP